MKLMRIFLILLGISSSLGLTGCNVSGDILDLTKKTEAPSLGILTGLSPGTSDQVTSGGYTIHSTVGEPFSNIKQPTSGGYTVYSNIEGNIDSEATVTVLQ